MKKSHQQQNSIRIIGGKWRGSKLQVISASDLRPTHNRIRETLFNWLSPFIEESYCLDLFAGTGALGLEALSRNAAWVDFIEAEKQVYITLEKNIQHLTQDNYQIFHQNALYFLETITEKKYHIIFLDPPYIKSEILLPKVFQLLIQKNLLYKNSYIYLETAIQTPLSLPPSWQIIRSKSTGQIAYQLIIADNSQL